MDEPAEENDPKEAGEAELDDGHQEAALKQLAETRDEEAGEGGDDVTGGALTGHGEESEPRRPRQQAKMKLKNEQRGITKPWIQRSPDR